MATPLTFTQLNQLYLAYFGRPVDYNGYLYYTTNNAQVSDVAAAFASSAESQALYGTGTVASQVNAIYQNLFNRPAELAGLTYWTQQIISGVISAPQAALQILLGAQGTDATSISDKLAASSAFFNDLNTTAAVLGYAGSAAAASARAWLATVTSDPTTVPSAAATQTAVNNAVAAGAASQGQTFNLTTGIDTITGTSGNDTFIGNTSAGVLALTAFDNINGNGGNDTLNITVVGALDTTAAPSVTVANIENANLVSSSTVKTDTTSWSGLTNLTTASVGGVTVNTATTTAVTAADSALGAGAASITGGSSVALTANGMSTGTITLSGAKGAVNVTAATVDGAGTAGAITVSGGTTVSVTETSGQKTVNTTQVLSAVTVNGGAATTTVSVKETPAATASLTKAGVTDGAVTITDLNSANTDGTKANTITTVTLDGYGAGSAVKTNALANLTLANSGSDVTVTDNSVTPTATTLNLTVNNLAGASLTDATVKTLNVTSTGKASSGVNLTFGAATAINFAGDQALALAALTAANATAITVAGAGGVSADVSGLAKLADVNASASSGANSFVINAGQETYEGGTGNDTVTISVAPTKTITGGGGNDTIIENAATDILTGNTKVSGFATLGLGSAAATTYDATGFSHLSIASGAAAAVGFSNVAAGVDLTLTGSVGFGVTYTLLNALGTSDSLSLNLNASAAAANTVNAPGIETVNIFTTDTNTTAGHAAFAETLTLSDSAVKTITANGSMGLILADTTDTAITTVNASGITAGGFVWTTGALANAATITGSSSGGDTINAAAATKAVTITEFAGTNAITGSSTVGSTLTGGTGADTITGGAGKDVIVGGGGADVIVGGAGADSISVSGNKVTIDNTVAGSSGTNTATNTQTAELTTTFDVITGAVAGDTLKFNVANVAVNLAPTNLQGVAGTVEFAAGTYASGTFTYSTTGADTAVTYDHGAGVFETIILVGYHAGSATAAAAGVVTLA